MVIGLGLTAGPSYWCTDFLLIQRALAAKNLESARKTPLVAAVPKMFFPAIVTLLGMVALAVGPQIIKGDYNLALPMLLGRYYSSGMLGLGLTALLASFMSGMAGNITAFNTVFTYDLYQTYLVKNRPDSHYLKVGKWATVWGTLLSCLSAYIALNFDNLMDYMQLIGILFIAPFFIVFLLGMFWKRASATAGFFGMMAGTLGCLVEYLLYRFGMIHFRTPMASNVWMAVWGFVAGFIGDGVHNLRNRGSRARKTERPDLFLCRQRGAKRRVVQHAGILWSGGDRDVPVSQHQIFLTRDWGETNEDMAVTLETVVRFNRTNRETPGAGCAGVVPDAGIGRRRRRLGIGGGGFSGPAGRGRNVA